MKLNVWVALNLMKRLENIIYKEDKMMDMLKI